MLAGWNEDAAGSDGLDISEESTISVCLAGVGYDSSRNDLFEFFPVFARVTGTLDTGEEYFLNLQGFTTMTGRSESGYGDTDTVILRGSRRGDWFKATTTGARMLTLNAWRNTQGFDIVTIYGRGFQDKPNTLILEDTPAADTLRLRPLETTFVAPGQYDLSAYVCNTVEATRVHRNTSEDRVVLNDSEGNDTLVGDPAQVTMTGQIPMSGPEFSYKVTGFPDVMAYSSSSPDDYDTAFFSDFTEEGDTFTTTSTVAELTGEGYRLWARLFNEVHYRGEVYVFGAGGQDAATLTDALADRTTSGPPTEMALGQLAQILWLNRLEKIELDKTGARERAGSQHIDTVFAHWE
ncbi:MAG: hypothetical protein HUU20_13960 [Pirellulales bacterium]|nr:hypothetical protein [Pirellulales bacterium]